MLLKSKLTAVLAVLLFFGFTSTASAHCDGLDGPVIIAAKKALETENVNLVLIWVQNEDEETIKKVFNHTLDVRKLGEEAQKLADRFFFETLVRIHRAGEGAPYTGLKPAGRDLGPAIPAADKSIESGSAQDVVKLLNETIHNGIHEKFTKIINTKNFDLNDVEAGREYVKAYVEYIHYVEGIYNTAQKGGHGNSGEESASHKDH